ncbi:RDD family protein [Arcanobacterium hippocoleae]|uniref:RDD family protein n=1 Tax=Arcanobacterium hippocoleae TaxID=149017 RepID=UPI00334018DB
MIYALMFVGSLFLLLHLEIGWSYEIFQAVQIVMAAVYVWIIPATVTAMTHGFSLGKLLLRIRVVRLDGGTISTRQSFIRALIAIFEVWMTLGVAGAITVLITKKAQRIGDMLAGTYVVRWVKHRREEPQFEMPAALQTWAQITQTRALPVELGLHIQNHLQMAQKLTLHAREKQALALAASAEKYVAPPVPWGTPPEDFLKALIILRYQIEGKNHDRDVQTQERIMQRVEALKF